MLINSAAKVRRFDETDKYILLFLWQKPSILFFFHFSSACRRSKSAPPARAFAHRRCRSNGIVARQRVPTQRASMAHATRCESSHNVPKKFTHRVVRTHTACHEGSSNAGRCRMAAGVCHDRPSISPSGVRSMRSACGLLGSPGMRMMSPAMRTSISAPQLMTMSRMFILKPVGTP